MGSVQKQFKKEQEQEITRVLTSSQFGTELLQARHNNLTVNE